jgi:predicted amidohydrolase
MRARAIECQSYVLAAAQWGHHHGRRTSFGHAMIVSPWGEILDEVATSTGFAIAEIDLEALKQIRKQLPSLEHRIALDVESNLNP